MPILIRRACAPAALLAVSMAAVAGPAVAQTGAVAFATHRAVYDLSLASVRGKSPVQVVRGRILYDFSGNACDGYDLTFRQVSELGNSEGRVSLSDLQSTSWEDGEGKSYRFVSKNTVGQRPADEVEGRAERSGEAVAVTLTKPASATLKVDGSALFPTQQMAQVITAASSGKRLLELPVYDGSDKGQKVYSTLTVIGKEIAAGDKPPSDAAAGKPELAALKRWPVTVSYFDKAQGATGEQTPVYSLSFELYENGISRALVLDYNDFVVNGTMSSLDIHPSKPCAAGK